MNTVFAFIRFYLEANFVLAIAFLLFAVVFSARNWIPVSYRSWNRLGQLLVVSALLSSLVVTILPERPSSHAGIEILEPIPDSISNGAVTTRSKLGGMRAKVSRAMPYQRGWIQEASAWITAHANRIWLLGVGAWGVGFALLLLRFARQWKRVNRLMGSSVPVREIGGVRILVSDQVQVPFSTWIGGRAHVVVPQTCLERPRDFRLILRHELQHHRNGDTIWVLFGELATAFFFLNPLVRAWMRKLTEIQEFACDEALLSQGRVSPHEYGSCLIRVAEAARGSRFTQVGTTCMGAAPKDPKRFKSFLRRRIEVFHLHRRSRRGGVQGFVLGTISLITIASVAYGAEQGLRSAPALKPNPGQVSFDPVIQKTAESVLRTYVRKFRAEGGFVLVSDAKTGRLLAAANTSRRIREPNWSLSFAMEPASAMKGVVAAAAVDQGRTAADEVHDCAQGRFEFGGRVYRDYKSFDKLTTAETIVESSNICGIKIGMKLGASGVANMLDQFGFGPGGTASAFPEARPGQIPRPGELSDEDFIAMVAVGYTGTPGFRVTPLEILHAYGAIANGGRLMKPILHSEPDSAAKLARQALSPEASRAMKSVLQKVVLEGTGRNAQSSLYSTAGKTSTAYSPKSPEHGSLGGERGIAGFVGFAPVSDPRVVIYVGVFDPKSSKDGNPHGNEHAAPVFRDVAEKVLREMNVAPDLPQGN